MKCLGRVIVVILVIVCLAITYFAYTAFRDDGGSIPNITGPSEDQASLKMI